MSETRITQVIKRHDDKLAGLNKTTSPTDTTEGRLLQVGDFGVGAGGPYSESGGDAYKPQGFYRYTPSAFSQAPWSSFSVLQSIPFTNSSKGIEIAYRFLQNTEPQVVVRNRDDNSPSGFGTWRAMYHAGNILGTVSQTAGVPTGAIIQRGSNANGEFLRFADGTQICWTVARATGSRNVTTGSIFQSALLGPFSWPVSFIVSPTSFTNTPDDQVSWFGILGNTSTIYVRAYSPTSLATSYNYIIVGVGRWF